MSGVLCCGNLVLDVLIHPVDSLIWGATTMVESIEQRLGGNGSNTSYALGRLGARVRTLGMVGRDAGGEFVLARLAGAGVDTSSIARSEKATATSTVLVNSAGDRLFLHRLGASAEVDFTREELAHQFSAGFSHLHSSSPFGLTRLRFKHPAILEQARAAGLTTSVDTHWDSKGRWLEDLAPCLPHTDILFVNEDEARMLTGTSVPAEIAAVLRRNGARAVVLKLSRKGCAVFTGGEEFYVPPFRVNVVDTTGAGDCFVAGFLAALDRGLPLREAARFANAVGALTVQKIGSVEGVRTWEETEAWMRAAAVSA